MEKFKSKSNSFEKESNQEHINSRIHLHFMRHGDKENDPNKANKKLLLSEKGRKQSKDTSKLQDITQAVAKGSPNIRAQETAALHMAGQQEDVIDKDLSFDELIKNIDAGREYGTKVGQDIRLDFPHDPTTAYSKEVDKTFEEGYYMKYLVEQSDQRAKELGDEVNVTYSGNAKQIGEIVDKYIKTSNRWDELVNDKNKNYQPDLERIMGTHGGVPESFLAKVIELTEGIEERDKFVQALGNNCFNFVEGYDLDIINTGEGESQAQVYYKKEKDGEIIYEFNGEISQEVLDEIIG